jgi:hypothetical protein
MGGRMATHIGCRDIISILGEADAWRPSLLHVVGEAWGGRFPFPLFPIQSTVSESVALDNE